MSAPREEISGGERAAGCLLLLALYPLGYVVWGSVAAQLWRWFVPRVWPSAPTMTASLAIGLVTLLQITRRSPMDPDLRDAEGLDLAGKVFAREIAVPLIALLVGYIAYRVGAA